MKPILIMLIIDEERLTWGVETMDTFSARLGGGGLEGRAGSWNDEGGAKNPNLLNLAEKNVEHKKCKSRASKPYQVNGLPILAQQALFVHGLRWDAEMESVH